VSPTRDKVLIVDDDPSHLEIYGLLLKQAGYQPVSALVRFTGVELPRIPDIDAIILDSRLNSMKTPTDLAVQIRGCYPHAPIVLLFDEWELPTDIAPYIADFVHRGEPGKLLEKLTRLALQTEDRLSEDRVIDWASSVHVVASTQ
jgi:DNA-binding NtrC family response regulator